MALKTTGDVTPLFQEGGEGRGDIAIADEQIIFIDYRFRNSGSVVQKNDHPVFQLPVIS